MGISLHEKQLFCSIFQTRMSVQLVGTCVRTDDASTLPGRLAAIVHLGSICPANTSVKVLCSILYNYTQPLQSLLYHATHVILKFFCFSWSDLFLNISLGFWQIAFTTYISDLFVKGVSSGFSSRVEGGG